MLFTKTSEILIKNFKNEIGKINLKISENDKKRTNLILNSILDNIKKSKKYVNTLNYNKLLSTSIIDLSNKKLPNNILMTSHYVPDLIKVTILEMKGYIKVKTVIDKIDVSIHFGMFSATDFNNLNKIKKQILEALSIVKFCCYYGNTKMVKTLDIYLYLTNHKKTMPNNSIDVLSSNNCNSAVTFACSENGKLLIYRKEEWKKVLIHELFHSLCLDFSAINYDNLRNQVKLLFKVESDYELSESYSEFWATIINSCFISYELLDDKNNYSEFLLYVKFCLNLELTFSLFQMIKVLNHMNMTYDMLYKNDKVSKYSKLFYKENTNVFCYYIIKTILLVYYDDFLKWCNLNNTNILKFEKRGANLLRFYNFIKSKYSSDYFIKSVDKMEKIFIKKKKSVSKSSLLLNKTVRMSICEN